MLHVPKLSRSDFESWLCTNPLQRLESLVIFKAPELTLDTIMWLLEELEAITELGDLHSMDFAKASGEVRKTWLIFRKIRIWTFQVRKLHQEVKKKEWDVTLVDSSQGSDTEERDFGKLQSLHWFVCLNNLIPEHRYCFIGTNFDSRFYLTPSEGYKQGHTSGAPRQHYYHWSQKKVALEICPQHRNLTWIVWDLSICELCISCLCHHVYLSFFHHSVASMCVKIQMASISYLSQVSIKLKWYAAS